MFCRGVGDTRLSQLKRLTRLYLTTFELRESGITATTQTVVRYNLVNPCCAEAMQADQTKPPNQTNKEEHKVLPIPFSMLILSLLSRSWSSPSANTLYQLMLSGLLGSFSFNWNDIAHYKYCSTKITPFCSAYRCCCYLLHPKFRCIALIKPNKLICMMYSDSTLKFMSIRDDDFGLSLAKSP